MQAHPKYKEAKARADCYPIVTIDDMKGVFNATQQKKMDDYVKGEGLKASELIANPCGLVAKTFFNG